MADILRNDFPPRPSEDIGDVLTSIRRLIAQDSPSDTLTCKTAASTPPIEAGPRTAAPFAVVRDPEPPLVLTPDELVEKHLVSACNDITETEIIKDDAPMFHNAPHPASDLHAPQNLMSETPVTPQNTAPLDPVPAADRSDNIHDDLNLFTAQQNELPSGQPLHGLIRDVVIREMEGELGSRMTRNLRQLIRSEISQALREATRAG